MPKLSKMTLAGFAVIVVAFIGATIFDGRNDFNNVMATVNLAVLGLGLVIVGSKS